VLAFGVDRVKICLTSSSITVKKLVVVLHTLRVHVGPKNCGTLRKHSLERGVADAP